MSIQLLDEYFKETLEHLASLGVIANLPLPLEQWLQKAGVIARGVDGNKFFATDGWLDSATPAASFDDLRRRTVIRDPQYRLHLDLQIAKVFHQMSTSGRWKRTEELLLGPFHHFAPRLAQIFQWQNAKTEIGESNLSIWEDLENGLLNPNKIDFKAWDIILWGSDRIETDLFSLLGDLYIPLLPHPVHVHAEYYGLPTEAIALLQHLITAVREGHGILVNQTNNQALAELRDKGLPIYIFVTGNNQTVAGLIAPVSANIGAMELKIVYGDIEFPLPVAVQNSTLIQSVKDNVNFWNFIDGGVKNYVFLNISPDTHEWPENSIDKSSEQGRLPERHIFEEGIRTSPLSLELEQSLLFLGNHPVYGLLLQLSLIEALDRELGEETLLLAKEHKH